MFLSISTWELPVRAHEENEAPSNNAEFSHINVRIVKRLEKDMGSKENRTFHFFFLYLLLKCLDFKTKIYLWINFVIKNLEEYWRFREDKVKQLMDYNCIFFFQNSSGCSYQHIARERNLFIVLLIALMAVNKIVSCLSYGFCFQMQKYSVLETAWCLTVLF